LLHLFRVRLPQPTCSPWSPSAWDGRTSSLRLVSGTSPAAPVTPMADALLSRVRCVRAGITQSPMATASAVLMSSSLICKSDKRAKRTQHTMMPYKQMSYAGCAGGSEVCEGWHRIESYCCSTLCADLINLDLQIDKHTAVRLQQIKGHRKCTTIGWTHSVTSDDSCK
jgi:hypothetical protein